MTDPRAPYKVKETKRFLSRARKLTGSFKRWDEVKETIDLDIARNPTIFEKIPGINLRAVGLLTNPPRTLYFSVDEAKETVILEDLI
jgi:hypothetical protein